MPNGWKLYGKTGSGFLLSEHGENLAIKHGWFIGWIAKDTRKIIFAYHLVDDEKE